MSANPSKGLRTCRYWALGPQCPNTDAFGTNVCAYAHWDTGKLASHFEQRGTCLSWRHLGYCGKGIGCWYEHRQTGVTGLFQGTVELTDFELQIADAATKAGFDTFRHEALFDLIWAVKRIALRSGTSFPQDPIYPDRYRPGELRGRNKKKKKRSIAIKPPPNHMVELQFHPIPPLGRKRPLKDTEHNLIDLTNLSDTDNEADLSTSGTPNGMAKRQKMSTDGNMPRKVSHGDEPRQVSSTPANSGLKRLLPASDPKSATGHFASNILSAPLTAEAEIIKQLLLVKTKLDDARKNMNTCQATMKTLFDAHYAKFDNDHMMVTMQKLSNYMNKVFDGGKDGAGEVDKAIELLGAKNDEIL